MKTTVNRIQPEAQNVTTGNGPLPLRNVFQTCFWDSEIPHKSHIEAESEKLVVRHQRIIWLLRTTRAFR